MSSYQHRRKATFFPQQLSDCKNCECASNSIPKPLCLCFSGSTFLVNFKTPNKHLPNVKYVF